MAVIICVVGDKGGIGKSTWARGMADVCRRHQIKAALFDADWISRSLFKVFCLKSKDGAVVPLNRQDPRAGCILYDIHNRDLGRDFLLNSMGVPGVDIILHDMPAGFRADFSRVMGISQHEQALQEFVASCRSISIRPVFVTPLTPHWAGHQTAAWLAEAVSQTATVIAVRNEQYSDDQFALWRNGDQARFLKAGGLEIAMPGLDTQTYLTCDTHAVRFNTAGEHPALSLADKLRVGSWMRRFEAELQPVRDFLALKELPEAGPTPDLESDAGKQKEAVVQ
ncbi:hypothetical protein [Azospirillum soli]|uniref:hypothetical protein n=1 Tax=Azospirillum soli TaxID=1304799 RepID=UPI001AEA24C4|nr:hypothetical protein [Azospirillum soli]MBP2315836.1 hypothetical protein [Azospirillum soli]